MIGVTVFGERWKLLEARFRVDYDSSVMDMYHDILTELMDDEQFVACCSVVAYGREFFPRPTDFVAVLAELEWPTLLAACRTWRVVERWQGDGAVRLQWLEHYHALSERGRLAVSSLGGVPAVRELDPDLARRRFTDAYQRSAVVSVQPAGLIAPAGKVLHLPPG